MKIRRTNRSSCINTPSTVSVLLALFLTMSLASCATTKQTRSSAKASGFLKDYSQLSKGGEGQARFIYVNSDADFSAYDKILLDPITIWISKDADLSDVPEEELGQLATYLHSALKKELRKDYTLVDRPGPGVMRVRVAMTEAKGSPVVMNVVSTVVPASRALDTVRTLATGSHGFVGKAAVEMEILDSLSTVRLVAAVDERAGGKTFEGMTSTWDDVEQAFDYWAEKVRTRLAEFRTK